MMLKTVLDVVGLLASAGGALILLSVRRELPPGLDKYRRRLGFALDLVAASLLVQCVDLVFGL